MTKSERKDLKRYQLVYDCWRDENLDKTIDWLEYIQDDEDFIKMPDYAHFQVWVVKYHFRNVMLNILKPLNKTTNLL